MHNADVFGRDFVSQFRDFLILIAAQRLQQCCALLFQPYKAKAACLSGQRVYRFDCCITIVPTQGIVQFRAARLVQKFGSGISAAYSRCKTGGRLLQNLHLLLDKILCRDISTSPYAYFIISKIRLARGENSFLSPFLDKDRRFCSKTKKSPDQMIRRFHGAANQILNW